MEDKVEARKKHTAARAEEVEGDSGSGSDAESEDENDDDEEDEDGSEGESSDESSGSNEESENEEKTKGQQLDKPSNGRPPLSARRSSTRQCASSLRDCVLFCISECKYPVVKEAAKSQGWKLIRAKQPAREDSDSDDGGGRAGSKVVRGQQVVVPGHCHVYWVDIANIGERLSTLQPWQRVGGAGRGGAEHPTHSPAPSLPRAGGSPARTGRGESCAAERTGGVKTINHFPAMNNIARKNRMAQHLDRIRRKFLSDYSFYPRTWVLPLEFNDFKTQFDSGGKTTKYFIIKPDSGCQGRGIFLTQNLEEVDPRAAQVAQVYVRRPLLVDGFKFDLRLYVLVAAVRPLRVYLCQDGLVRLCTEEYVAPSSDNLADRRMHLTNYAINKHSENFQANTGAEEDEGLGSKRSLKWFLQWVEEEKGAKAAKHLFQRMGHVCVKTLISILPTLQQEYNRTFETSDGIDCGITGSRCIEVLGFDIMLDSNFKIWLVEVNHLPSFATDSPLDKRIKSKVVNQAMSILRVQASDKSKWKEMSKEREKRRQENQKLRQMRNADPGLIIREKILEIYQKFAPDKVSKIQALFPKYKGKEEKLFRAVEKKYVGAAAAAAGAGGGGEEGEGKGSPSASRRGSRRSSTGGEERPGLLMPPTPPWEKGLPRSSNPSSRCGSSNSPRRRRSLVAKKEISFQDIKDNDGDEASDRSGAESETGGAEEGAGDEGDPYAVGPDGVSLQDKGYFITPEIAEDINYEEARLPDWDRVFPPPDRAEQERRGALKYPDYQKFIDYVFEQDMKRHKRMHCPIGQKNRNALEFADTSLPEIEAKFKQESPKGNPTPWGGAGGGAGWGPPPQSLFAERTEPLKVPGKKQIAAAERLAKGYTSHRRNMSAPSRTGGAAGYSSETNGLSQRVSEAMEYGRQYRQKVHNRMERKSLVAVKINTMNFFDLPDPTSGK